MTRLRLLVAGAFLGSVAIGLGGSPLPLAVLTWTCGIAASVTKRGLIRRGEL